MHTVVATLRLENPKERYSRQCVDAQLAAGPIARRRSRGLRQFHGRAHQLDI